MKRVLCLLTIVWIAALAKGQDFASRFMQDCSKGDTTVHCITISPKMMEKVMKAAADTQDPQLSSCLSKLRSARIVEAEQQGEKYYNEAIELLKRNNNRFKELESTADHENSAIYVRRHNNVIVELVMLHLTNAENQQLQIINFTGTMDDDFIEKLSKSMGGGRN